MQPDAFADAVVVLVKNAIGPVLERLAAAEARLDVLGDLRDRVVTVETKAAQPLPEPPSVDLRPVMASLADLTKDCSALRERVAVAEVRSVVSASDPTVVTSAEPVDHLDDADAVSGLTALLVKELVAPVPRVPHRRTVRDATGAVKFEIEDQQG